MTDRHAPAGSRPVRSPAGVSDPDRLERIKARRAAMREPVQFDEQVHALSEYANHAPGDLDWLVGKVERLQRYEAMWNDCRGHRDQAEKRARRLQETVTQVAELVAPPEDEGL